MSHEEARTGAQDEARTIVEDYIDVQWSDELTRDEAEDALGYSWSNISDIYPAGYASRRGIENAAEGLRDAGFYVSIDLDDGTIVLRVSTSHETFTRHVETDE
jgi:hypothetical protein